MEKKIIMLPNHYNVSFNKHEIWKKKLLAFALDLCIVAALKVLIFFAYQQSMMKLFPWLSNYLYHDFVQMVYANDLFLTYLVTSGYFTTIFYLNHGQTIGMQTLRIHTIHQNYLDPKKINGFKISLVQSFLKSLSVFFTIVTFGLSSVYVFINPQGKTLGEAWSQTMTVTGKTLHQIYLFNCQKNETQTHEQTDAVGTGKQTKLAA